MEPPPEGPPHGRGPFPSQTRKVRASEINDLIDSTRLAEIDAARPAEEVDTHALAGAEIAALLGSEPPPPNTPYPAGGAPRTVALAALPEFAAPAGGQGQTVALPAMPDLAAAPMPMPAAPGAPVHPDGPLALTPVPGSFSAEAAFAAASLGAPAPGPNSAPHASARPAARPLFAGSVVALAIAVGAATILAVIVGVVLFSSKSGSGSGGIAVAPGSVTVTPPVSAPQTAASTAPAAPAAPSDPESEARAALGRLREGIGSCVRDVIGVLPGTAPAIPGSWALMKDGAYKSLPRDFRSPVYICAKYKETEPQRFQIQWQLVSQKTEGRGVAWIDGDGDGKPEKALSFKATFVQKNQADLGEIEAVEPLPQVIKTAEPASQK